MSTATYIDPGTEAAVRTFIEKVTSRYDLAGAILGKTLKRAEELRLIADYKGDPINREDAARAVEAERVFVDAMRALIAGGGDRA